MIIIYQEKGFLMSNKYTRLKLACYSTNVTMSVVSNLSPILFLTFRDKYDISYSLLGLLVLVNFITQLSVDLVFSFLSHKFNITKTVIFTPLISAAGLVVYALMPHFFPQYAYIGLAIGTFMFSVSGGLVEVLISPVIAAIPSKDPDREMSKLHSVYAWGVVAVVILSTLFLLLVGGDYWYVLALLFTVIPISAFLLYLGADIPTLNTPERVSGAIEFLKNKTIWLFVMMIFIGGASEVTMAQWSSGFLEQALGIPKLWGDVFGVALFSVMLGLGRSLYAKFGKNISKVLLLCVSGAFICYLTVAICDIPIVGLIACALTGFATSMLWPGSLIAISEKFPAGGVFIYAIMAAGGDLGASVSPQLIGIITDVVIANPSFFSFIGCSLTPDQLGLKIGMFVSALFPLMGIPICLKVRKILKNKDTK